MSTSTAAPSARPEHARLLDDAALLRPAAGALERHRSLRTAYGDVLGDLVVDDVALPGLVEALGHEPGPTPVPVQVLLSGGAGSIEPAAAWVAGCADLELRAVVAGLRDLDDLAGAARRTVAAADAAGGPPLRVDVPVSEAGRPGWLAALDELATAEAVVTVRPADQPPALVAETIDAALDRELALAGLLVPPAAVLPLLRAVRATLDGDDVLSMLSGAVEPAYDSETLARTRRWFRSAGVADVEAAAAALPA